jgi:hypothetical protein
MPVSDARSTWIMSLLYNSSFVIFVGVIRCDCPIFEIVTYVHHRLVTASSKNSFVHCMWTVSLVHFKLMHERFNEPLMCVQMNYVNRRFRKLEIMSKETTKSNQNVDIIFEIRSIVTCQIIEHLLGGNRMSYVRNGWDHRLIFGVFNECRDVVSRYEVVSVIPVQEVISWI